MCACGWTTNPRARRLPTNGTVNRTIGAATTAMISSPGRVSVSWTSRKPSTTPAQTATMIGRMKRTSELASAAPASATNEPRTISTIIGPKPSGHGAPSTFPYSSTPQLPFSIAWAIP